MNRRTAFALLCTLVGAAPLAAQAAPAPAAAASAQALPTVGSRIRVSAPTFANGTLEVAASAGWQTGTVKSMEGRSLVLLTEAEEVDIPFDVIRRVEISEGAMSSSDGWRRGARRGGLIGAGLATAVFAVMKASGCNKCGTDALDATGGNFARGLAVGAGVGAGLGVVLGSRERERWRRVDVTLLRPAPTRP